MPLEKGNSSEVIGRNIKKEEEAGKPHEQAVAIALHNAKDASDFERMAKDFHRKPILTAAKDAVLNWAGGRYEYKPGGAGDKKKPLREVAGI